MTYRILPGEPPEDASDGEDSAAYRLLVNREQVGDRLDWAQVRADNAAKQARLEGTSRCRRPGRGSTRAALVAWPGRRRDAR